MHEDICSLWWDAIPGNVEPCTYVPDSHLRSPFLLHPSIKQSLPVQEICLSSLSRSASVSGEYSSSRQLGLQKMSNTSSIAIHRMAPWPLINCATSSSIFRRKNKPPERMLRQSSIVSSISTSSSAKAFILKPSSDIS